MAELGTLQNLYENLLHPVGSRILPKLEMDGMFVIKENLEPAREECRQKAAEVRSDILEYVPPEFVPNVKSKKTREAGFNPGSSKQLGDVLFNYLGLKPYRYTAKGDPSTDESTLKELSDAHPIVPPILKYRKWTKFDQFLTRWGMPIWEGGDCDPDGFIHPHYNMKPVTGRLSSEDPNLQQAPKDSMIRKCLGAPPGYLMLRIDYSQIELRVAAHYSQDPRMMQAYRNGEDLHSLTASQIAGLDLIEFMRRYKEGDEEMAKMRKNAKPVNFGFLFGMFPDKFIQYAKDEYGVIFTLKQAEAYREAYFRAYAGLLPWHEEQIAFVREHSYVRSFIGRVRHLHDIKALDWLKQKEAERQAINSPVQGLASDFILMSSIEIDKELPSTTLVSYRGRPTRRLLPECRLSGLVHDEMLYIVKEDKVDYWKNKIIELMENPPLYRFTKEKFLVPIIAECDPPGRTWGG